MILKLNVYNTTVTLLVWGCVCPASSVLEHSPCREETLDPWQSFPNCAHWLGLSRTRDTTVPTLWGSCCWLVTSRGVGVGLVDQRGGKVGAWRGALGWDTPRVRGPSSLLHTLRTVRRSLSAFWLWGSNDCRHEGPGHRPDRSHVSDSWTNAGERCKEPGAG